MIEVDGVVIGVSGAIDAADAVVDDVKVTPGLAPEVLSNVMSAAAVKPVPVA